MEVTVGMAVGERVGLAVREAVGVAVVGLAVGGVLVIESLVVFPTTSDPPNS